MARKYRQHDDLVQLKLRIPRKLHGELVELADREHCSLNTAVLICVSREARRIRAVKSAPDRGSSFIAVEGPWTPWTVFETRCN